MFSSGSSSSMRKKANIEPLLSTRAHNPWSQDDNKLGQKMLEKMGWKKGQGVGLHNQGMAQNIKLIGNKGSKGLGFRLRQDDLWTAASDNFTQLLSELSNGSEIELTSKQDQSLQLRSQRSRSRVFYKKFSRGKDISEYDMKDLSCVIGGIEEDIIFKRNFMDVSNDNDEFLTNEMKEYSNLPLNDDAIYCREMEEDIKPKHKRKKLLHSVIKEEFEISEIEEFNVPDIKIKEEEEEEATDTGKEKRKLKRKNKRKKSKKVEENECASQNLTVKIEVPDLKIEEEAPYTEREKSITKFKRKKSKKAEKKESISQNGNSSEEIKVPVSEVKEEAPNTKKEKKKLEPKNKPKKSKKSKEKSTATIMSEVEKLLNDVKQEENVEDMKKFIIKFEEEASQLMKKHNEELNKQETYRLNENKNAEKRPKNEKAALRMKLVREIKDNNFIPSFKGSNLSIIEGYPTSKRYSYE